MITGKTKVVGIFGSPIEHTLSPLIHNVAFQRMAQDICYVPFQVQPDKLGAAVEAIRALELVGVNITIPFKEQVIPWLDELSPEAKSIGAVNTVVNRKGHLIGHNTDGLGFVEALYQQAGLRPAGKKVLILGAGGAARGVALTLGTSGAKEIILVNRHLQRAEKLKSGIEQSSQTTVGVFPWETEQLEKLVPTVDMIINTTPLGMFPNLQQAPDVPMHLLQPHQLVCDLIYNPLTTSFLQQAAAQGCTVVSGWGMLLYQAVLAFKLWTGLEPPVALMQQTLLAELAAKH